MAFRFSLDFFNVLQNTGANLERYGKKIKTKEERGRALHTTIQNRTIKSSKWFNIWRNY